MCLSWLWLSGASGLRVQKQPWPQSIFFHWCECSVSARRGCGEGTETPKERMAFDFMPRGVCWEREDSRPVSVVTSSG
jgi:hypothetical protein